MGALRPEGEPADPVALETPVVATGARPGSAADKRELFVEETQTVLVFEKGAVIRLSAGVVDGQLLFLTNKKNGKEVVTQVVRKRSFRPTSCYVDLEFTEPCPGFWGIEFPKSAPSGPGQVTAGTNEEDEVDPAKHAAPSLAEVDRLKKEVSELQAQLKSLIAHDAATSTKADEHVAGELGDASQLKQQHQEKQLEQLLAQEAEQEKLHGPKRLVAYPQKSGSSAAKTAGKLATAAAFVAAVAAGCIAAYRFGLLDSWIKRPVAASTPAPHPVEHATSAEHTRGAAPSSSSVIDGSKKPSVESAPRNDLSSSAASREPVPPQTSTSKAAVSALVPTVDSSAAAGESAGQIKTNSLPRSRTPVEILRAPSAPKAPSDAANEAAESGASSAADGFVAAKLIRAIRPVSPPEALRNYVTGNVNVDALVDATGHVKSVTVLSGPQKLHKTAIEQMKEYVYEPARKNGKAVPSHVQVSLQYWYEP